MTLSKTIFSILGSLICNSSSFASPIDSFLTAKAPKKSYFQCAFQKKIASKKCLVSITNVPATTARAKSYFGTSGRHDLLTITWPDHDISPYILIDDNELWNIKDNKSYKFRELTNEEFQLDLSNGLIIDKDAKEHIRLW